MQMARRAGGGVYPAAPAALARAWHRLPGSSPAALDGKVNILHVTCWHGAQRRWSRGEGTGTGRAARVQRWPAAGPLRPAQAQVLGGQGAGTRERADAAATR